MVFDPEKIVALYFYLGIIGTIVFLLKVAIPVDTASEVFGDFSSITDTDLSFRLLTVEGISAFFMCFGILGWVSFTQLHLELKISMCIAVLGGLLGLFLFAWLLSLTKKMEQIVPYNLETLVGKVGKAYVHFDPKGTGKIQIEFNSRLDTLDAVNNSEELIEAFTPVKVVKVENNIIYIEKE